MNSNPHQYHVAFSYDDGAGRHHHGVLIPNGVLLTASPLTIDPRRYWHWHEAREIRDRHNASSGAGSHWIVKA